jgi:chromosome segregation protein
LLAAQCASLTASSGGAIRADVKRFADASNFGNSLRQALSGSRVQGGKIEALGESIAAAENPAERWTSILNDLERLAEFEAE